MVDELVKMPGHLVRRVQQVGAIFFAQECGELDMTTVQFAALLAIKHHPNVDATRLSGLIAFDQSTLADVLRRLQTKGWIERHPSPTDGRVKLLRLTPEGAAVLENVRPRMARAQERLVEKLSPDERDVFLHLLAKIADVTEELEAARNE